MDKAKQAVSGFLNKDGNHDTTVHETVNPAVTHENVTRTQHENKTTAVDREIHQDHYHTSVQPVKDREVLPEKHTHQMAGVEHREFNHGNDELVKQRLQSEAAQFKDHRTVGDVQHTSSAKPTLVGEHVHHHVHENIQPVVQKETIQPSVVHTTVPVHEVHQNEAKHHTASQLPAVSMHDFKNKGGHLEGRAERSDAFVGEPKSVGGTMGGLGAHGTTSLTEKDGHHGHHPMHSSTTGTAGTAGPHNSSIMNKVDPRVDSDMDGTGTYMGSGSSAPRTTNTGVSRDTSNTTSHGTHADTKKPSLLDRINPMVDADGDGKKGFMK
ncbi:hypothetical protein HYALB_00002604 [Hymenoscyphus albidus]|uniref:Allergen n=1 Tax=Hymenoscyphus albidus TaxID=595503 RepID=A0A9N9Q9U7_9HELO|nr:hypothetical protein HYALB_00002604 [Hymenoscyphus albidus]